MSLAIDLVGIGVVSPYGCGRERFWNGLWSGATQFVPGAPDEAGTTPATARVSDLPSEGPAGYRDFAVLPRPTQMGILAAMEAWVDAEMWRPNSPTRVGLYVGSSYGLLDELSQYETDLDRRGLRAARPSVYQEVTLGALAGHISVALDIRGPIMPLAHGWLSAFEALDLAMGGLAEGILDAAVVVAVEALGPSMIDQMCQETPGLERIGEGAVALFIERREAPLRDSAYCQLGDAVRRRTARDGPDEETLAEVLTAARGGHVALDGIFGFGGVDSMTDRVESSALSLAFDKDLENLHIALPGALIGNTASCAILFNVAAAALSLRHGELPATPGTATPSYTARVARATRTGVLLASGRSSRGQYGAMLLQPLRENGANGERP